MVVSEDRRPILQQCLRYGGQITGLVDEQGCAADGARVLWAIAGCESDYGRLAEYARHEPAYMPGGRYYQRSFDQRVAWQRWGVAAACSWGAWQLMAPTAREMGYAGPPSGLMVHEVCARWATTLIVQRFIQGHGARSIRDVLDAYNSGSHRDRIEPVGYIGKGLAAYAADLPTL